MQGRKRTATTAQNQLTPVKPKKTKVDNRSPTKKLTDSAFSIFMEEFRKDNKDSFPEHLPTSCFIKGFRRIWKNISGYDKGPYFAKARLAEHEIAIKQRHDNKILVSDSEPEEEMQGSKRTATIAPNKLNPDKPKKTKVDNRSPAKQLSDSAFSIFMEEFRKDNKDSYPEHIPTSSEKGPYFSKARYAEHDIAIKQHRDNLEKAAMEKASSSSLNTHDEVDQKAIDYESRVVFEV